MARLTVPFPARSPAARPSDRPDPPTGPIASGPTVDRRPSARRPAPATRPAPPPRRQLPPPRRSGYPAVRLSGGPTRANGTGKRSTASGGRGLPYPTPAPRIALAALSVPFPAIRGPRSVLIYATPAAGALAGRATVETALRTVQFRRWLYGNPPPASRRTGGVSRAPRRRSGPRSSPVYTIRRCPIYRRCISALKLHFTYLPAGRPS